MYENIPVPNDGSRLSQKAVKAAARLAKALAARITAAYVMPGYMPSLYGEATLQVTMKIQFPGATNTVTGSKYPVSAASSSEALWGRGHPERQGAGKPQC